MSAPTKTKPAEEETKGLGLSPTQIVAGAGASVTSTVLASTAGIGGTLTGAAAGSVVSTVAAALYAHSLKRGRERITKVIPVGTPMGSTAVPGRDDTKVLPAHLDPRQDKPKRFDITLDRKFWTKIAIAAVGMFILVMGIITAFEFMTQKPVSALVGNTETSRTTTLGTVTTGTSSTIQAPEDDQQEDTPVTTSTPDRDDQIPGEPVATESAQPTQDNEEQGGTQVTRTAESTSATSDRVETNRESTQEEEPAPAQEGADTEPADPGATE